MKHFAICVFVLLAMSALSHAQYSTANLSGTYSFQLAQVQTDTWSKTFECVKAHQFDTPIGSFVTTTGVYGTVTFDGAGNFTYSLTQFGAINEAASANTMRVLWSQSCTVVNTDFGHIVYLAPKLQTGSGTYAVNADGTGTMTESGVSQSQNFVLGSTSSGVSSSLLLSSVPVNGSPIGTGSAARQ